jgi:hypothetical protein
MKQVGIVILVSVFASAVAPGAPRAQDGMTLATQKSVDQFGGCFVDAQDRESLAWSYVPKANGGTFSNLGAEGARGQYFLAVSDRGANRQVRLEAVDARNPVDTRVVRAVNQCA